MNKLYLKLIAAITMVFDHTAIIFLQQDTLAYSIFRVIGRISFVLFAYMIAEGFHKTKNLKSYLLRLLVLAIGIELFLIIFYFLYGENYILRFNIIWTLLFGLLALFLFYHKNQYLKLLVIPIVFLSEYIDLSYGAYGVLMIIFFGLYNNKLTNAFHLVFLNLLFIDEPLLSLTNFVENAKFPAMQWFSIVAIIFIFLYNGNLGKYRLKWFFYVFYPGHLLLLYAIRVLI
jgi:hypothetical protein